MPPKSKMTVMEYQHPIWRDILHPIESLKSYKKTGKTLGKQLKDLKKEIDNMEEEVNIAKTKLRGRRDNAASVRNVNNIKRSVKTLKLLEKGLSRSIIDRNRMYMSLADIPPLRPNVVYKYGQ